MLPLALGLLAVALIGVYLALCGLLYGRVFVPPRPGLLDDFMFTPWEIQAVYEAIAFARRRIKDARIGLLGYSMGAVVSMLGAAGEPGVEALVLDSPFSDLRRLLNETVRRLTLLPGQPFVAMASLWLRWRAGCS